LTQPLLTTNADRDRLWLCDLASRLPPSTKLRGFDISSEQFPSTQSRPSNVEFDTLDVLQEPPLGLHGQFNVVHLRLLQSVVNDNNPSAIISHCLKLLSRFPPRKESSHVDQRACFYRAGWILAMGRTRSHCANSRKSARSVNRLFEAAITVLEDRQARWVCLPSLPSAKSAS